MHEGTLKHQTWDQASHTWSQRRSPPQPNITVIISAREEDFRAHGHTLARETHHLTTTAMPDTGVSKLSRRPLTDVKPPPVRERAHPGEPRDALGQRNQPTYPRSRTATHTGTTHWHRDMPNGLLQQHGNQTLPEPCNLRRPGADPKRVSPSAHRCHLSRHQGNPRLAPGNTTLPTHRSPADQTPPTRTPRTHAYGK